MPASEADMGSEIQPFGETGVSSEKQAIRRLRDAIMHGKHWYVALLEAIGQWDLIEENYKGRDYCYLIANEAFDWLLLAERILDEVGHLVPQEEAVDLLFHGKAPVEIADEEFCNLIGEDKYRAHLNFFYGVTVEESLIMTAEEEAHKERRASPFSDNGTPREESYQRIYGNSFDDLLKRFRKEKGYSKRQSMALSETKEFTYWLFKYRLNNCDKARIASDTKKALKELNRQRGTGGGSHCLT
jgi:hypothetical protein